MTKIPSEWPEKMASTKISWSDDIVVWLESAGEACILERADALVVGVDDRPRLLEANAVKSRRRLGRGASGILSILNRRRAGKKAKCKEEGSLE